MTNHEKFLGLYNDLDDSLRKRYHNNDRTQSMYVRFVSDLNRSGAKRYMQIAKKLNMIRVIRNNLVHELDMNKDNLIEITDETIKFLEDLIKLLDHPMKATDIGKPIEEAFVVNVAQNAKVKDLMKIMREKGYSQIPILKDNGSLSGVFSPNVLFEYMSHNADKSISELSLLDLKDVTPIDKHFSETYIFIAKDMLEEDIDDLFTEKLNANTKLAMMFVTENGDPSEKVIGIIVLKDLISASMKQ